MAEVLGNRLSKIDYGADPDRKTLYYYDSDPNNRDPNYPTNNNRLLWYEEYVDDNGWTLTRTIRYTYYVHGHVSNITIKDEYLGVGDPNDYNWYRDLAMYYDGAGRLWRVLWDYWKVNQYEQITDYEMLAAREFYYDGLGQRYLTRDVEPDDISPYWWPAQNPQHLTDYTDRMPYGDHDVTATWDDPNQQYYADVDEQERYLSGFGSGIFAQHTVIDPNTTILYFHGDIINSTMLSTDENGATISSISYTAFGETVSDVSNLDTRYQYACGWGYESDLLALNGAPGTAPIILQHVGARWYQPNNGRFIQRDPIGLYGGHNTYTYAGNCPTVIVDPSGLRRWTVVKKYRTVWVGGRYIRNPKTGVLEYEDIYNLQAYKVTYEDHCETGALLGVGSIYTALGAAGATALGGPAGLVGYLTCVSIGLGAGGVGTAFIPPSVVSEGWVTVGPPVSSRDPDMDIKP